jgi:hypothetical protein
MWADEYPIFNGYPVVNGNVILNLYIFAYGYASINVDTSSKDTILSNRNILSDLALMPDTGAITNICFI